MTDADRSVGHFREQYLQLTETFIYHYLTNHDRYRPFVCSRTVTNLDKFPFSPRYSLESLPKTTPRRWYYRLLEAGRIRGQYYRDVLAKTQPDVAHAHFGPMGAALTAHGPIDPALVTTFYGYDLSKAIKGGDSLGDRFDAVRKRHQYSKLFERGDLFLVEGPAMKEKLVDICCPEDKAGIQHIGIDAEGIEPSYPEGDDIDSVLMVGRFVEKKGMPDGIRAFGRVFAGTGTQLRIVGGGTARGYTEEDLRGVAASAGVEEQVVFTGYLDHGEYLAEVADCDVLLVPSKTAPDGDSEGGAPTVILEAQAHGKPVVGTTHADIPYYVADGTSGGLARTGDVSGIADELQKLSDEPKLLCQYGKAGREYVLQSHEIRALSAELERKYDRLLD